MSWTYDHFIYNCIYKPNDQAVDCRDGLTHSRDTNPWWARSSLEVTAQSRRPVGVQTPGYDSSVAFAKSLIHVTRWLGWGSRNA
jgi:hypothetical protein